MVNPQMVMYEEEFNQIQTVVDRLVKDANARVVFIVDKNGQLIAAGGDSENVDTTSLASLTATAAQRFSGNRLKEEDAAELALMQPPAFVFLHDRRIDLSSTDLRARQDR